MVWLRRLCSKLLWFGKKERCRCLLSCSRSLSDKTKGIKNGIWVDKLVTLHKVSLWLRWGLQEMPETSKLKVSRDVGQLLLQYHESPVPQGRYYFCLQGIPVIIIITSVISLFGSLSTLFWGFVPFYQRMQSLTWLGFSSYSTGKTSPQELMSAFDTKKTPIRLPSKWYLFNQKSWLSSETSMSINN